jgi:hypothetical protein
MIEPPGAPGVVFGARADGDARSDGQAREALSTRFGISRNWATIRQVHGAVVATADGPGFYGEADALVTNTRGLPIAIATADCVPVVLVSRRARAVVHTGWRGVAGGAVPAAMQEMERSGDTVVQAIIGPHIGPCCYEVGREVVDAIGGFEARTRSGGVSVDLAAAVSAQMGGIEIVDIGLCTFEDENMASYRQDGTPDRQVTVAWIPQD